jgi:hypothetical protein
MVITVSSASITFWKKLNHTTLNKCPVLAKAGTFGIIR